MPSEAKPTRATTRAQWGRGATSFLAGTASLCVSVASSAGQVEQIASFGNNPSGIGMYLYTPSNVSAKPPVLVGVHACHGKGTDVCAQGAGWVAQADKFGFLLVCPSAVSSDGCWDVHSTADLTHNGGGDASGIVSMVGYVVQNRNGDASRVYVAGHSSGGMMTNVLLGAYPDVFKAGAAFAGVAFGCFAVGSVDSLGWNAGCATGNVTETGVQWGDMVRAAYPGFTGIRPRIELWHGTVDATVSFHNFGEEIKEWTNVLGASATPSTTENDVIQPTWIRTRYTDGSGVVQVEAIQETGQPHNLIVDQAEAIHFFGLDGTSPAPGSGPAVDAGGSDAGRDGQAASDAAGRGPDGSAVGSSSGTGAGGPARGGGDSGVVGSVGTSSGGDAGGTPSAGGGGSGGGPSGNGGGQVADAGTSAGGGDFDGSSAMAANTGPSGGKAAGQTAGRSGGCSVAKGTVDGTRAERGGTVWLLVVAAMIGRGRSRNRARYSAERR